MYSGITCGLFPITKVITKSKQIDYSVSLSQSLVQNLKLGSSVNIDGVCQSVTEINGTEICFTAIDETLRLTTLSDLFIGRLVSIEPSLRYGDEVGGHLLAGHINGTAELLAIHKNPPNLGLTLSCPSSWMKYIFSKGFIGIDGSSLTVGTTNSQGHFTIHLIPETIRVTNFGNKKIGECFNIELDQQTVAIVNTVERVLGDRLAISG